MKKIPDGFFEDYQRMRTHLDWLTLGWQRDKDLQCAREHYAELAGFLDRWSGKKLPKDFDRPFLEMRTHLAKFDHILTNLYLADCAALADLRMDRVIAEMHLTLLELKQTALESLSPTGQKVFLNKLRKTFGTGDFAESYRLNEQAIEQADAKFKSGFAELQRAWSDRLTAEMRGRLLKTDMDTVIRLHLELGEKLKLPIRADEVTAATALIMAMGKPPEALHEDFDQATTEIEKIKTPLFPDTHYLREELGRRLEQEEAAREILLDHLRTVELFELAEARMNIYVGQRMRQCSEVHANLMMRAPEVVLSQLLQIYLDSTGEHYDPDQEEAKDARKAVEYEELYQERLAACLAKYGGDLSPLSEMSLAQAAPERLLRQYQQLERMYLALERRYPGLPDTTFRRNK